MQRRQKGFQGPHPEDICCHLGAREKPHVRSLRNVLRGLLRLQFWDPQNLSQGHPKATQGHQKGLQGPNPEDICCHLDAKKKPRVRSLRRVLREWLRLQPLVPQRAVQGHSKACHRRQKGVQGTDPENICCRLGAKPKPHMRSLRNVLRGLLRLQPSDLQSLSQGHPKATHGLQNGLWGPDPEDTCWSD